MKTGLFILFISLSSLPGFCQKPDTLIKKLDSLSNKTDSAGGQYNNINPAAYNEQTKLTFPSYCILLGSDLKQAFTKPFHMSGKDWGKLGLFAVVEGGLAFADEPLQRSALRLRTNHPGLLNVSKYVTNFGGLYEGYTLAAFGAYGLLFKKDKMKTTTLLATQAYITGAAVESVVKFLTGRRRPSSYDVNANEAEPAFGGPFTKSGNKTSLNTSNGSFPSGHTTVAFAAATVFAMEYKDKPYIPVIAYSAATLIGISRITENKHWATDVLAGAALGYLTGRLVVNNYHRYANLEAPHQKRGTLSFGLQYNYGVLMPGMVYHFK